MQLAAGTQKLPPELLSRIFHVLVSSESPFALYWALRRLGEVSRLWQSVAFSTPELWTRVPVPLLRNQFLPEILEPTKQWIQWSGQLDFDVIVEHPLLRTSYHCDIAIRLAHLVADQRHRLRRIYHRRDGGNDNSVDWLYGPFRDVDEVPKLQSLSIIVERNLAVQLVENGKSFKGSMPHLHSVRLSGVDPFFPLVNIQRLHIARLSCTTAEFRNVVESCPTLTNLVLLNLEPLKLPTDHLLTYQKIEIPSLRHLTLGLHWSCVGRICILQHLSLPRMASLELVADFVTPLSVLFSFKELESVDTLKLLQFLPIKASPNAEMELLRRLNIKTLCLQHTSRQLLFPDNSSDDPFERRTKDIRDVFGARRNDTAAPSNFPDESRQHPSHLFVDQKPRQVDFGDPCTYPLLHTIVMDALPAAEVAWLCEMVRNRSNIKTVHLSSTARRHLTSSLFRESGVIAQVPWRSNNAENLNEWLVDRVHVKDISEWDDPNRDDNW